MEKIAFRAQYIELSKSYVTIRKWRGARNSIKQLYTQWSTLLTVLFHSELPRAWAIIRATIPFNSMVVIDWIWQTHLKFQGHANHVRPRIKNRSHRRIGVRFTLIDQWKQNMLREQRNAVANSHPTVTVDSKIVFRVANGLS
jgi:hypothetical protein